MLRNMSDIYRRKLHAWVSPCKMTILILLLTIHSSTVAVTLSGSSEYAVPGNDFTLTCDVPDEANSVQLYRRPDVFLPVGSLQVALGQCYNTLTTPVQCGPNVCSCIANSTLYGTVFQWVIRPRAGDHGSVWFCRRNNPNLPVSVEESPDYTLNVAAQTVSLSVTPSSPVVREEVTFTCDVRRDITTNIQVFYRKNTILVGRSFVNSTSCTSLKTQEGENYTFTCGSFPVRQMSLTIPAAYVTEDEHGTDWTCEIFLGAVSNIVQLTLIVPVTTATMTTAGMYQPSVMITAEYNRTFLCTTSAGRPVAKIAWFREEKNITDHAGTAIDQDTGDEKYSRQQSLTIIGSVNDADSGLKCEAVNIEGRIPVSSQTSNIIIQWAPQTDPSLTIDPANKKLTDGVSVTMTCRQVGGKPLATLTWSGVCSFWNTTIDSRDNTTVTSSIHFSMNKTYTGLACICVSRQQVNSYQKSVNQTFDVLYPPDQITITYSNYSSDDDTASRQLRCAPDGNPQSFTFSKWQHMSEYSQLIRELDGVTSGNESVLTIPDPGLDARYQDTGYYVCRVQNGVPGRNNQMVFDKRVFLSVNAPPVFDHSTWIFPGQMEKSITISVLFYSTSGYSKVELFSNQTVVGNRFVINTVTSNVSLTFHDTDITVGGFTATVSVQTLQHEDFTNYTLRVTNDAGIQNFGFYLSDKGPPSPPTHVFADCKGFGSAEVSWRAGNNGGYKQTFQVLYKTDGSVKAYRDIIIENGTDDYVMTLDNLEENSLHIFTILALNSFGNVTSTEIGKCTVHEKLSPTENTAMFNAGVAMLCIGIIAVISTMAIIIVFIKRKITCLSRGKETEQPIHLGNMNDAGPRTPGEDRTLYEKIDSDGRVQPSEYESIGKPSNSDASTTDRQQDSRAYESLHGRSQPNTYEDLGSTDNEQRGDRDYINRTNNDYINA